MTVHWRFKDEWLLKALSGLEELLAPFIARSRAHKAPYLSHSLINSGFLTEARLGRLVEMEFKVKHLRLTPDKAGRAAVDLLGERLCRKLRAVPVGVSGGRLHLATDSPLDRAALAEAGAAAGLEAVPYYCLPLALEACLDTLFNPGPAGAHRHPAHDGKTPAAAMAGSIILQARRLRADEVRIEHDEGLAEVKVRIDGTLRRLMTLSPAVSGPLVARLKALAHLDISDRVGRQEGAARLSLAGAVFALHISVQPDIYGENAVIRLPGKAGAPAEKPQHAPRPHRHAPPPEPPPVPPAPVLPEVRPSPELQPAPARPAPESAPAKPLHKPAEKKHEAPAARPQHKPAGTKVPAPEKAPHKPAQPAHEPPAAKPRQAVPPAFTPQAREASGKPPIMIAHPDEQHRAALAKVVEASGFEAVQAENGADAFAEIAQGRVPDLLITGLDMPLMTGLELINGIRRDLGMNYLPILILTSDSTDESQELAFSMGADDYVSTPFSPVVLGARLRAALRRAGRRSPQK